MGKQNHSHPRQGFIYREFSDFPKPFWHVIGIDKISTTDYVENMDFKEKVGEWHYSASTNGYNKKKAAARDIVSLTEVAREWLLTWEKVGGCHYYAQVNCAEREI